MTESTPAAVPAKRQMANLWGRSIGQLNQKITDVELNLDKETNPPTISPEVLDTSNTDRIPGNVRIWLNVRNRLRVQRFYCGTRDSPSTPDDDDSGGNEITAFGDNYGEAKWYLKFVDPNEEGRVWAWTDPVRLVPRTIAMRDDYGNSLLGITVDQNDQLTSEAWGMDFDEDVNPTIMVNHRVPELKDRLMARNEISLLIMPEVLSHVVDRLITTHCETTISPGSHDWQGRWLIWAYNRIESRLPDEPGSREGIRRCFEWKAELLDKLKDIISQATTLSTIFEGGEPE